MKTLLCTLALLPVFHLNAQELTMMIVNPQINGNQITYDVRTENFTNLVGMQYSIVYNSNKLTFVALQNLNLSDLDLGDFNPNEPGVIRNVWIQTTLTGVTVDNGVIYQIVFEMVDGEAGDVCFSEDPLVSEFIKTTHELTSFSVMDDCHPDPFQIFLTTSSVEDITTRFGISFTNPAHAQTITFKLDEGQNLGFRLFDLDGKSLMGFPQRDYEPGYHTLNIDGTLLPGMYILATEIQNESVSARIIYE